MSSTNSVLDSTSLLLVGTSNWLDGLAEALTTRTAATVQRARTAANAVDRFRSGSVDCLVTEH